MSLPQQPQVSIWLHKPGGVRNLRLNSRNVIRTYGVQSPAEVVQTEFNLGHRLDGVTKSRAKKRLLIIYTQSGTATEASWPLLSHIWPGSSHLKRTRSPPSKSGDMHCHKPSKSHCLNQDIPRAEDRRERTTACESQYGSSEHDERRIWQLAGDSRSPKLQHLTNTKSRNGGQGDRKGDLSINGPCFEAATSPVSHC